MEDAAAVVDFWFGELDEHGFVSAEQRSLWFSGKRADAVITQRFGRLVERALAGELDDWALQQDSLMALVTLLDQFPRNIYRASPRAFSGDSRARQLVHLALADGRDREMPAAWRMLFYLPLEHAENLADQNLCVALFELMLAATPESYLSEVGGSLEWARRHRDIVARFGRFPHRNEVLQRIPTAEEDAWLAAGGDRFGQ